jgi:hypothetical protein
MSNSFMMLDVEWVETVNCFVVNNVFWEDLNNEIVQRQYL